VIFFCSIRYTNGRTSTGNALEFVRAQLIFNAKAGARENVKKIIFVITDGRSNLGIDPNIPARKLKDHDNVTIVALGVTNKINQTELLTIASSSSNVFHLKDFAALKNLTQSLQNGMEIIIIKLEETKLQCQCTI
jgi:uncharacterized protein YegL